MSRLLLTLIAGLGGAEASLAAPIHIDGPPGSVSFGEKVGWLPNGRFYVVDVDANSGAGAVHLYSDRGALLATLAGTGSGDRVGSGGVFVIGGDLAVLSPQWRGGVAGAYSGAVSWIDGDAPVSAAVSAGNSLVGATGANSVGSGGLTVLANGNVVVASPGWEPAATGPQNVGAATWMSAATPATGPVSASNSLVGTNDFDEVASRPTVALANGHYVVVSPAWSGTNTRAGAVTWGNGSAGTVGTVSTANSVYGTDYEQYLGGFQGGSVTALANGHYVVTSVYQDNGALDKAGAVRWCSGTGPCSGAPNSANSLVGTKAYEYIGNGGVRAAPGGSFIVASPEWDGPAGVNLGAVTWSNGTAPLTGEISAQNSLVGASPNDMIAQFGGIDVLADGNFLVRSPLWNNGAFADVGAATWISAASGRTGVVSSANSVYGSEASCFLGVRFAPLDTGDYVVGSPECPNAGVANAGIVARIAGGASRTGAIGPGNAILGSHQSELIGTSLHAIPGGDFLIGTPNFGLGQGGPSGALTWIDGSATASGILTTANSFVGIAGQIVATFPDGRFAAASPSALSGAGAVTAFPAGVPITGQQTTGNSFVGIATNQGTGGDDLGSGGIVAYASGDIVVVSSGYDSAGVNNGGAVTLVSAAQAVGTPTIDNSVFGTATGMGYLLTFDYHPLQRSLLVGQKAARRVSILRDVLLSDGFE